MSQRNYYNHRPRLKHDPGHQLQFPSLQLWPVLIHTVIVGVILGMGLGDNKEWMGLEPQIKNLTLITYTHCGAEQEFKLITKIQNECKDLGIELGIDEDTLDSLDKSSKDVCIVILTEWKKRGDSDYDVTWAGLLKALKNAELGGVAKQLERALTLHANKDNLTLQNCNPPEWMKQEPNMTLLTLIKYTDCEGKNETYNLIVEIQNDCKHLGNVLDIEEETLNSLDNSRKKRTEVCMSILSKWMERGDSDYETTWEGLLDALKYAKLGGVAKQLERALTLRANKDNFTLQNCDPPKWMKQEPNMTLLTLIPYTDCAGKDKIFNLIDEIKNDCKHLGNVLDIEEETLTSFEDKTPLDRCKSILQIWIQRGEGHYNVTWDGLLKALNHSRLGGIAKHLEKVLILIFHANMEPHICENLEWTSQEPNLRQLAIIKTKSVEEGHFNLIVKIQRNFNYLGMVMGIDDIDTTRCSTTDNCKDILGEWIKRGTDHSHYEVTWAGLLEALEEANLTDVAEEPGEVLADNSTLKKCQNMEWMNQDPLHILHKLMNRRKVDHEWACNELLRALEDAELGDMVECLKKVLCNFFP